MTANEPQPAAPPPNSAGIALRQTGWWSACWRWRDSCCCRSGFDWFAFNQSDLDGADRLGSRGTGALLDVPLVRRAALLFRWRFQYSLRSLMLLVVAVAIACSWLATEMRSERKQRAAAEAIKKAGGRVVVRTDVVGELLRDDSLVEVDTMLAILAGSQSPDAGLVHLQGLSQLQELELSTAPKSPTPDWCISKG